MPTITFIANHKNAASSRYRALHYFRLFKIHNFQPQHINCHGNILRKIRLLWQVRLSDITIINRKLFPYYYFLLIRLCAKKLYFDFDDAIYRNSNHISKSRQKRFARSLPYFDGIWAGNQHLADTAKQYNSNVYLIPTSIDFVRYQASFDKEKDYFDLVWIGSNSTKKYLKHILPALESASKTIPRLRLKIIADFTLESDSLTIIPIQWSAKREVAHIKTAHIGIAPMIDNEWTRGKCALKVLQYMAASLPVISSSVGANQVIIKQSQAGLLADNEQQWINAITRLEQSESLRNELAENGLQHCRQFYSQEACFKEMLYSLNIQP